MVININEFCTIIRYDTEVNFYRQSFKKLSEIDSNYRW